MFKKKQEPVDYSATELQQIDQEYKREATITRLRPILVNGALWAWAIVDGLLLVVVVGALGMYLVNGAFVDKRLTARFAGNSEQQHTQSLARQAVSLVEAGDVQVFNLGDGRYDFLSLMENPNESWVAEVQYHFVHDGGETEKTGAVIGPGVEMPLAELGVQVESGVSGAELVIDALKWHRPDIARIDPANRSVGVAAFFEDRSQFLVTSAQHGRMVPQAQAEPGAPAALAPASPAIETVATITNQSAYGFWDAEFYVIVEQAGAPVGVNVVTLKGFESGESREIRVRWFGSAPTAGEVRIIPAVNVFDKSVYMPLSGATDIERL